MLTTDVLVVGGGPAGAAAAIVLARAGRDVVQINKRVVHRQMEVMGLRTGIRIGTELCALGVHQQSMREFVSEMQKGLTEALTKRDAPFGDYRTAGAQTSPEPGEN